MTDTPGTTTDTTAEPVSEPPADMDPVRRWTLIVAGLCLALLVWYLVANRHTPFTSQARINAYVVPVAPDVGGRVISVEVANNSLVEKGERLLKIDPELFELAVIRAQADERAAHQDLGAAAASVESADAALISARANLVRNEQDTARIERIFAEDPGAISERRVESARASLTEAQGQLAGARANLEKAIQQRGEAGEDNSRLLAARSALAEARLNLERTEVVAPERGLVTDLIVDAGNFAAAGQPLMTFIAIEDVWIQADLTENNLGHVKPGDRVEIVLDVQPGRVYPGRVRSVGYGVSATGSSLGALPTVENDRNWLRDAQRFPVIIDFATSAADTPKGRRVGSQADIIVYTGDGFMINALGWLYIRLISLFSFVY
jgi:multidrug resistance efflux pump